MNRLRRLHPTRRLRAGLLLLSAAVVFVATACGSSSSSPSLTGSGSNATKVTGGAASGTNHVNKNWPAKLVVGEVGAENSTTLLASLKPLNELVQKKLGVKLDVVTGTSYASMIEAQQAGKAQIVGYGPFSWYIARDVQHLHIQLLAIPITAPHTDGGYHSWAVVNPKLTPNITSLKQAKGQKVCFSDPASTSGFLFPSYGLLQQGINPQKDVKGTFAGTDTATALEASKGQCAIGFTNSYSLPAAEQAHQINPSDVKIIWKSQEIPASPMAISDSVPASLRSALEKLMVQEANSPWLTSHGYCSSVAKCTETTGGWGYAAPSVAHYGLIAKVCKLTKSPACKA